MVAPVTGGEALGRGYRPGKLDAPPEPDLPPAERAVRATSRASLLGGVVLFLALVAFTFIRAGGFSLFGLVLGVVVGGGIGLLVWTATATTVLSAGPGWARIRNYGGRGLWVDLAHVTEVDTRGGAGGNWSLVLRDATGRRMRLDPDLLAADPVILGYVQKATRHLALEGRAAQLLRH